MASTNHTKLKKDDNVIVIAGKEKGKTGRIVSVDLDNSRVTVEGLNMVSKAKKRRNQQDQGGIIQLEGTIQISNVALVDGKGKATRATYKIEGDTKTRVAVSTGEKL